MYKFGLAFVEPQIWHRVHWLFGAKTIAHPSTRAPFGDVLARVWVPARAPRPPIVYVVPLSLRSSDNRVQLRGSNGLTATSLPIYASLSSAPNVISSTNRTSFGNGLPNITNVLTDFQIAFSVANHYKPVISYAPQDEYRLIDVYGTQDLSRIDLQVDWKDKKGVFHLMLLHPGCSASVKFLFRLKRFYLGD